MTDEEVIEAFEKHIDKHRNDLKDMKIPITIRGDFTWRDFLREMKERTDIGKSFIEAIRRDIESGRGIELKPNTVSNYLICRPVFTDPRVPGSVKDTCVKCGWQVWTSPCTVGVKAQTGYLIICYLCAMKQAGPGSAMSADKLLDDFLKDEEEELAQLQKESRKT